jgi:hypothetical protein
MPAKSESPAELIARLQGIVQERMVSLEPQVGEAKWLERELEILDFAIEQRDHLLAELEKLRRPPTKENVNRWARMLEADEEVRASDLADAFFKQESWARIHLRRLEAEGTLEKWGRGMWRLKPVRTGEATLHLVTKGA